MTVNLTALAEARAKMTQGAMSVYNCGQGYHQDVESCGLAVEINDDEDLEIIIKDESYDECHHPISYANAAGIVATHNAADVLIEVARTDLAHRAAEVERAEAFAQWSRSVAADDHKRYAKAVRDLAERRSDHLAALAKVTL